MYRSHQYLSIAKKKIYHALIQKKVCPKKVCHAQKKKFTTPRLKKIVAHDNAHKLPKIVV